MGQAGTPTVKTGYAPVNGLRLYYEIHGTGEPLILLHGGFAVFKRDGWYPEILAAMAHLGPAVAEQLKQSPLYQTYSRIAPKPGDWTVLVTKMGDLLRRDFDWSKDIAAIKAPTTLVFGDADSMPPEHIVEFFKLLGGGKKDGGWDGSGVSNAQLAILPGVTHYNIVASPSLAPTVLPFLDAPTPGPK